MRCLLFAICFFVLAPAFAGASPLRLAYIKHGYLYTLAIDRAGRPRRGAKPIRIRAAPSCTGLVGTPDGRYVAAQVGTGIQVISLRSHKIIRWPDPAGDPSFSPNGNSLVFTAGDEDRLQAGTVKIISLDTGRVRVLRTHAWQPRWSADGRCIAVVGALDRESDSFVFVLDAKTGHIRFRTHESPTWGDLPILSPKGRYLALRGELSRPIMDDSTGIIDTRTGRLLDYVDKPGRYVAGFLQDWSRNGKWLLWIWAVPDPNNDGSYLWSDIGLTSFPAGVMRKIGLGKSTSFSPDSRHVLWLEPKRKEDWNTPPYDLMGRSFNGSARRLVAGVDAYCLVGAYSDSRWQR